MFTESDYRPEILWERAKPLIRSHLKNENSPYWIRIEKRGQQDGFYSLSTGGKLIWIDNSTSEEVIRDCADDELWEIKYLLEDVIVNATNPEEKILIAGKFDNFFNQIT